MNLQDKKPSVRYVSGDPINDGGNPQRAMKARQNQKIDQLRQSFLSNGRPINQQADLLGLCRSTAYAVLRRDYKHSGLTAAIIKRMLASPDLPERTRNILHEYIAEKNAGFYGHSPAQRRRFINALVSDQDSDFDRVKSNGRSRCDEESQPMSSGLAQALRENCEYLRDEGWNNIAVLIELAADELDRLHERVTTLETRVTAKLRAVETSEQQP